MILATIFACVAAIGCHTQQVRVQPKICHYQEIPFEQEIDGQWVKGTAGVRCGRR